MVLRYLTFYDQFNIARIPVDSPPVLKSLQSQNISLVVAHQYLC